MSKSPVRYVSVKVSGASCSEGHCPAVIWLSPINRPRCGVDGSRYFPGSICPWVALRFSCYPQSSPLSTFLFLKNWGIPGRKKTKVKRLRFRQSGAYCHCCYKLSYCDLVAFCWAWILSQKEYLLIVFVWGCFVLLEPGSDVVVRLS